MMDDVAETGKLHAEHLCEQLIARRKELGLEQSELAQRVGVNRALVVRMESGETRNPQLVNFVSLALALNLRPELVAPTRDQVHEADIVHRGAAYNRTKAPQDGRDREREAVFASQWEDVNKFQRPGVQGVMPALVPGHTQEQATAAATVIQWLGSQVGFQFLTDALDKCGYELVDRKAKRR